MKCLRYIFLFGIIILLFSCKKFKGSQEIPAYLKIEPWTFTTNYEIEGAATHAITDAWVYVDGSVHGCFEMKQHDDGVYSVIPLLNKGNHKLQIYPGVKLNGISSTRIQYPFYQPYVCTRDLVEGEITTISPSTRYYSIDSTNIVFKREAWEDFEEVNNIHIYRIDTTYAELHQISHRDNPNAWMDPLDTLNHYRSGHVHVGDSVRRMALASAELYNLPNVGNYVLMEMDYKCSADILIGMYIHSAQQGIMDKELYYLRSTNTWKKVYINFSPTITENQNADYFKFYLKGAVAEGGEADFYFDNIKLIYVE
ncbi:MAG: hypothetical protein J6X10_07815 [Bacteroidales bacterium]|nr:hypothetical protein [Bacteroidales bacterium]